MGVLFLFLPPARAFPNPIAKPAVKFNLKLNLTYNKHQKLEIKIEEGECSISNKNDNTPNICYNIEKIKDNLIFKYIFVLVL